VSTDSEILARLDERTKYIKEKLDQHIESEDDEKLPSRVAKLETNISWIKRIGIGSTSIGALITAFWKGLS
jgi:hypothetical protein